MVRVVKGMGVQDGDFIEHLIYSSTHDMLLFFTNAGKVYSKKAYEIPEYGRMAKGLPVVNLLQLEKGEKVQTVINIPENADDNYLFFITKMGTVKRTHVSEFSNIRTVVWLPYSPRWDELSNVLTTDGNQNILIGTHLGYAVTSRKATFVPW